MNGLKVLTSLGGLGHDVANVVLGAGTKDIAEALGTLNASSAQAVLVIIGGLLAVADEVDGGLGGGHSGSKSEDVEELHCDGCRLWIRCASRVVLVGAGPCFIFVAFTALFELPQVYASRGSLFFLLPGRIIWGLAR